MNLIKDAWLPIIRSCGKEDIIAPWQIAESDNPAIEINAPRPDFQGALYQFIIGLLQTCFAPEDHDEWLEYWEDMPDIDNLKNRFMAVSSAFDLDSSDGAVFMQDIGLSKGEEKPISALLIDAPGGKTIKDNQDHFVKRDSVNKLCCSCAATALFTLQINAPSGGVGHRVSLRGGGPITTLVRPAKGSTLWQKLWLNILDEENFSKCVTSVSSDIFPWMAPTRTSEKKGTETRPGDVHNLQIYWAMPRRIRLNFHAEEIDDCDLCDATNVQVTMSYSTQNYGVNYEGEWIHPLTPYHYDRKKEKQPLSLKGRFGGLSYQHWLGLVTEDPVSGNRAAKVTRTFWGERMREVGLSSFAILWAFGYYMDKMKARCWYDHTMPLFQLDSNQQKNVMDWASELIDSARFVAENLRKQVKAAWFRRPKDVKGDMSAVSQSFWQQSEAVFYSILESVSTLPGMQRQAPPEIYDKWLKAIRSLAYKLFDEWALESSAEDLDMKRIIAAREGLKKQLNFGKAMKTLSAKTKPEKEDEK